MRKSSMEGERKCRLLAGLLENLSRKRKGCTITAVHFQGENCRWD